MKRRALRAAILCALFLAGCGGGGGGGGVITFALLGLNPAVSADLGGGDVVIITGTDLDTVTVVAVRFGTEGATILSVSATEIRVQTPAQTNPGAVDVEVETASNGMRELPGAYEYRDSGATPNLIAPTVFTPTGGEAFLITGTNLGPPNGSVDVEFGAAGTATGTVNGDGTQVSGFAPVTAGVPPVGPITVTLDPGGADAQVPQQVSYDWEAPVAAGLPSQNAGAASRPVKITDGFAALCIAGANGLWGDADDQVVILVYTAGPPVNVQIRQVLRTGAVPVGFLSPANSLVIRLDSNSFALFSPGPDNVPNSADDTIVHVTSVQANAQVTFHTVPNLNGAPLARVDDDTVATIAAGPDTLLGTIDDSLLIFNLAPVGATLLPNFGPADTTPGFGNVSIPESPDGDAVFASAIGPDLTLNTADDSFRRFTISSGQTTGAVNARFLNGRPIFLSATLVAATGAGTNGTFGDADDELVVFRDNLGVWQTANHLLGGAIALGSPIPFERIGTTGMIVPVLGTATGDLIRVYTDPFAGTNTTFASAGAPLLALLGNGSHAVFGPGSDLTAGTADDRAFLLEPGAGPVVEFAPLLAWTLAPVALTDQTRAFAVTPGDGVFLNSNETIQVYQSTALGAANNVATLPASTAVAPVAATESFVPIGPNVGVIQSPGLDRAFGTGDDQIVFVRY